MTDNNPRHTRLPMYRQLAGMIKTLGTMSADEMVQMFPAIDRSVIIAMRDAKFIDPLELRDGGQAYRLTAAGRALVVPPGDRAPALPRTIVSSGEPYQALELRPFAGRPGAMDHEKLPSRIGNDLIYRDGRKEKTNG